VAHLGDTTLVGEVGWLERQCETGRPFAVARIAMAHRAPGREDFLAPPDLRRVRPHAERHVAVCVIERGRHPDMAVGVCGLVLMLLAVRTAGRRVGNPQTEYQRHHRDDQEREGLRSHVVAPQKSQSMPTKTWLRQLRNRLSSTKLRRFTLSRTKNAMFCHG